MKKTASNKTIKKTNLPDKLCPICKRTFTWRKKWENNWNEVVYCSTRCSSNRRLK